MARGGKRPGAGRKKGAKGIATKKRLSLAKRLNEDGVSPLEIMTITMQDLWREANQGDRPNIGKRMQAVMLAEKCAPYLHPRLAATTVTGKNGGPIQMISRQMTAKQAAEAYASTLHGEGG